MEIALFTAREKSLDNRHSLPLKPDRDYRIEFLKSRIRDTLYARDRIERMFLLNADDFTFTFFKRNILCWNFQISDSAFNFRIINHWFFLKRHNFLYLETLRLLFDLYRYC